MRFPCTLTRQAGAWLARHESRDAGAIEVRASSRDEVLEKLKGEIRYRLELCPCTGETYQHIDVEIVETPR